MSSIRTEKPAPTCSPFGFPRERAMYVGKLVFSQVMDHVPLYAFRRWVSRYQSERYVKQFRSHHSVLQNPVLQVVRCPLRVKSRRASTGWGGRGKSDIIHGVAKSPLIAKSGHAWGGHKTSAFDPKLTYSKLNGLQMLVRKNKAWSSIFTAEFTGIGMWVAV